jgi:hypothetical protein
MYTHTRAEVSAYDWRMGVLYADIVASSDPHQYELKPKRTIALSNPENHTV